MSLFLARKLQSQGLVQATEIRRAIAEAVLRQRPLLRALAEVSSTAREYLAKPHGTQGPIVQRVEPAKDLCRNVAPGLLGMLLAVPIRKDPRTGTVDVALVDPDDTHAINELSHHLQASIRPIAASLAAIERALASLLADESMAASVLREDVVVPLVRRSRTSLPSLAPPPSMEAMTWLAPASIAPPVPHRLEPSRSGTTQNLRNVPGGSAAPAAIGQSISQSISQSTWPTTSQSQSLRAANLEGPRSRRDQPLRRAPFPSLTPILDEIDRAATRDILLGALVSALESTALRVAVFVPRRGNFTTIVASEHLPTGGKIALAGGFAQSVECGEWVGPIDLDSDPELVSLLGPGLVLLQAVSLGGRTVALLGASGMGDLVEATRRARVIAIAAASAFARLLKR